MQKRMKNRAVQISFLVSMGLAACQKDDLAKQAPINELTSSDSALWAQASKATGFQFYKGDSALLRSDSTSGHSPYFRIRYNEIAWRAMTDGGKLPKGKTFPEGALIVKDLYNDQTGGVPVLTAVMKKEKLNPLGAKGWIWAEYLPQGANYVPLTSKGAACTSCHSNAPNRDLTRVFDIR